MLLWCKSHFFLLQRAYIWNRNLQTSKVPLKSQAQGTSLFTSTEKNILELALNLSHIEKKFLRPCYISDITKSHLQGYLVKWSSVLVPVLNMTLNISFLYATQYYTCNRSVTSITSLWNRLPPSARASFLSSNLSTSLSLLKTCLFSWS